MKFLTALTFAMMVAAPIYAASEELYGAYHGAP